MPKFGDKLVFRLHPLHNGQVSSARLSEEWPQYRWNDPSCTIHSDLETNGFSQVALQLSMMGFAAKWPNCKKLNVTITHYDGRLEKFSHEVQRGGWDSFLGRPVRLAAQDGSFSGEVKICIEPDGNTVASGEHSYVAMFRYSPSHLCHETVDDRLEALCKCHSGYERPNFNKKWLPFQPIPPTYQDSASYQPPTQAIATSYKAPRANDDREASASRSNTERSSSSTPAPTGPRYRGQTSSSTSEHRSISVQARSSSATSLSSRVSTNAGSATALSVSIVAPALATFSRPTTPATYSSQTASAQSTSWPRPSGQALIRAIEAQRREIEELKREEAEAQRREEEEEETRRRVEEIRRKQAQEAEARRQQEEAKRQEEEARRRRDEEVRRRAEEESRRQEAAAAQARREQEAAQAQREAEQQRRRQEEEAARARREADERHKRQEEQARLFEEYKAAEREAKLLAEFEAQEMEYRALLERKNLRLAASQSQAAAFYPAASRRTDSGQGATSSQPTAPAASYSQPSTDPRLARSSPANSHESQEEPSQSRRIESQLRSGVPVAVNDAVTLKDGSAANSGRIDAGRSDTLGHTSGSNNVSTGQGQAGDASQTHTTSAKRVPLAVEEAFVSAKRRRIEQDNQLDESYTMTRPIKLSQSPPPYTAIASVPHNAVGGDGGASSGREYWQALFVQSSRPA